MIEITRGLIQDLRSVFRRSVWASSTRGHLPLVLLQTGPDGLTVQSQQEGLAVACTQPGDHPREALVLPGKAFQDLQGGGRKVVQLEALAVNKVRASWQEGQETRSVEYDTASPESVPPFPAMPENLQPMPADFFGAMNAAMQTTQEGVGRPGLSCVQMKGSGALVATDGRQLLIQKGFSFPWTEDLLLPRTTVFAARPLQGKDVFIGRTRTHVGIRAGPWKLALPLETTSRYPDVARVIPTVTTEATRWKVSEADAAFLQEVLPTLPGEGANHSPITLDLGETLAVRARQEDQSMEVVLSTSERTGPPLRVLCNRQFLRRALILGLREFVLVQADAPIQCQNRRYQYVWVTLEPRLCQEPQQQDVRITSPARKSRQPRPPGQEDTPMTQLPSKHGEKRKRPRRSSLVAQNPSENDDGHKARSLLEEVNDLQQLLRQALARTRRLAVAIRQERRQRKLIQTTLASLRQLQQVED